MVLLLMFLSSIVLHSGFVSGTFETIPRLPKNNFAIGLDGLHVSTQLRVTNFNSCVWRVNGEEFVVFENQTKCDEFLIEYNTTFVTCENETRNSTEYITAGINFTTSIENDLSIEFLCHNILNGLLSNNSLILNAKNCSLALDYDVTVETSSTRYNAAGEFRCPGNYTLLGNNRTQLESAQTACLAIAEWREQNDVACVPGFVSATFETTPRLPNNTFAIGLDDLHVSAQFEALNFASCVWQVNGEKLVIFQNQSNCDGFSMEYNTTFVTCENETVNDTDYITAGINFTRSIESDLDIKLLCYQGSNVLLSISSLKLNAENCSSTLDNGVIVETSSTRYNATGEFRCPNNYSLFDNNETQLLSAQTTCLATTEWSKQNDVVCVPDCDRRLSSSLYVTNTTAAHGADGEFACSDNAILFFANGTRPASNQTTCNLTNWIGEEGLQCWKAPSPKVEGSLTELVGNTLTLQCQYDDVLPLGTLSLFFFNGTTIQVAKGDSFTTNSLTRNDDGKEIFCQAVTPYTELFNATGRSAVQTINVQFTPLQENETFCEFVLGYSAVCPVTFYANPEASFMRLRKNGQFLYLSNPFTSLIAGSGHSQTFYFIKEEVTLSDNGTYILTVQSLSTSIDLTFTVNVISIQTSISPPFSAAPETNSENSKLIAVAVIFGFLILLLLIGFAVYYRKSKHSKQSATNGQTELNKQSTTVTTYENVSTVSNITFPALGPNHLKKVSNAAPTSNHDYVNLQDNVNVEEEKDGYISLTPLSPEMTVPSVDNSASTTSKQEYDDVIASTMSKQEYDDVEVGKSFVPADDKSNHVKMIGLMLNRNLKEKLAAQGVKKNKATDAQKHPAGKEKDSKT